MADDAMSWKGEIGEVDVNQNGEKCVVEWKMDFKSLSPEENVYYSSRTFYFEGKQWWLVISPNRITIETLFGYIQLQLHRGTPNDPPINLEVSFALKTVDGQRDSERRGTKLFDQHYEVYSDRLISTSDFVTRRSDFLESGFLTVIATLKRFHPTENENNLLKYKPDTNYERKTGEVLVIANGVEKIVEWKIDFFVISTASDAIYSSPPFHFEDKPWRLGIWLDGFTHGTSLGCIYLKLYRASPDKSTINLELSFALKTLDGQKYSERRGTKVFHKHYDAYIDQLITKQELDRRQSDLLPSGFLTVIATLKKFHPTENESENS